SNDVWAGDNLFVGELNVEQALLGRPLTLIVTGPTTYDLYTEELGFIGSGIVGERFSSDAPFIELMVERIEAPANVKFTLTKRNDTQMIRNLQGRFAVTQRGRDTGILELTLIGPDRSELKRSLDAIANVYLIQNINRQAAEAESRLQFLEEQTPLIQDGLNAAENELNEYRATQDSVDLTFETQSMLERMVGLDAELNALQIQESELSQRFTPSHPSYRALLEKRAQLQADQRRLENQVNDLPETQRQVLRLTRDVE